MRIFNEDKTKELKESDIDLSKGWLKDDTLIKHINYVEEKGHWETIAEYDNGGKDVKWVVEVEGHEEHDEKEFIKVYIPYTERDLLLYELQDITEWFDDYDNQVKQYERCQRLGVEFDKDMVALDNEATQKQLRIREIRGELNGK